MRISSFALVLLAVGLGACAAPADEEEVPAEASGAALTNDVLVTALAAGKIGETPTGYLGIVDPTTATSDLKKNVQDNFIKRKAVYTKIAESFVWTTVDDVAKRNSCSVYASTIPVGNTYKTEAGAWTKHTATAPVIMPSWCPQQ